MREARLRAGYTLEQAAPHIGLVASNLSRKERGQVDFLFSEIETLSELYGVPLSALLKQYEKPERVDQRKALWEALYHRFDREGLLDTAFRVCRSLSSKRAK